MTKIQLYTCKDCLWAVRPLQPEDHRVWCPEYVDHDDLCTCDKPPAFFRHEHDCPQRKPEVKQPEKKDDKLDYSSPMSQSDLCLFFEQQIQAQANIEDDFNTGVFNIVVELNRVLRDKFEAEMCFVNKKKIEKYLRGIDIGGGA